MYFQFGYKYSRCSSPTRYIATQCYPPLLPITEGSTGSPEKVYCKTEILELYKIVLHSA